MRLFALAALISIATAASAAHPRPAREMPVINPNAGAPPSCPATSRYEVARRGGKLPPTLLTELPAADLYSAVYRKVGGCEVPIIARFDIGGPTRSRR